MALFVQQLINGLAVGATYGIFAMGFGLVFGTLNILNLAHGVYATWGALIALWAVANLGLPFPLALLVGLAGAGVIGVAVNALGFHPLRNRGGGQLPYIITSFGFWIILRNVALLVSNARFLTFPRESFPDVFLRWGGLNVPLIHIVSLVAFVLVTVLLHLFLQRARVGLAIRAVGWSGRAASLSGVDSRLVIVFTMFLAAAIAGLGGVLSGLSTNNVSWSLGDGLLLKGFAAVVVGGFGDVRGAALGGLFIGVSEVLAAQYISNSFRDAVSFGVLIVFLLARPQGLFSKLQAARA